MAVTPRSTPDASLSDSPSSRSSVSPRSSMSSRRTFCSSSHTSNSLISNHRRRSSSASLSSLGIHRSSQNGLWNFYAQHQFWVERLFLLSFSFFVFWHFRTGSQMVNDLEQEPPSFLRNSNPALRLMIHSGKMRTMHPQETYSLQPKMTRSKMEQLKGPSGDKYNVLVTGAAGFVGMYTALELKKIGMNPIGYDVVNPYYSQDLKELRIRELEHQHDIPVVRADVCDTDTLTQTIRQHNITRVIHLAAQAGVRYSLDHPDEYTRNNVDCFVRLLETMVKCGIHTEPLVYASSSSVYGNNAKVPFRESDRLEDPASLYAATKRSDELIAQTYFNLHGLESVGLRFFTVYGPFGRPDMAPWIFTDKISSHETIRVFNHGNSRRDFTFVGDIVQGVVNSLFVRTGQPELVNLGNGRPVLLADFVRLVEQEVGVDAVIDSVGMQKGDVPVTYADITKARRLLAYNPTTPIEEGIVHFVSWFREYNATQFRMNG